MHDTGKTASISGVLAHPAAVAVWLLGCIICAAYGKTELTFLFCFLLAISASACLWGQLSLKRVDYRMSVTPPGVFPGQSVTLNRTIKNGKWLPLIWLEVLEPSAPDDCLRSENAQIIRNPDLPQTPEGEEKVEISPDEKYKCLYSFPLVRWYEEITYGDEWRGEKRGIHEISSVKLRSGDGFGLSVKGREIITTPKKRVAVYPTLVNVSIQKVLEDIWEARANANGLMEDESLLKSVRPYQPSDPSRRINFRLLARGQDLQVNTFEIVSPDGVMFYLDAASFASSYNDGGEEAFEMTLSIVASMIDGLIKKRVSVGLAAQASPYFPETIVQPSTEDSDYHTMLELLAGASVSSSPFAKDEDTSHPALDRVGQVYYISFSPESATSAHVLEGYPVHKIKALLCETDGDFNVDIPIRKRRILQMGGAE